MKIVAVATLALDKSMFIQNKFRFAHFKKPERKKL